MMISLLRVTGLAWDIKLARIKQPVPYDENDRLTLTEEDDRLALPDEAVA